MFKPVKQNVNFPNLEKEILEFWKKNKIFEKSLEKPAPKGKWNFLDGPPFITGLPHYGSLLSSLPKDLFPRYRTMQGYSVRRVWGWDCHGLPAENKVENKLGIKRKKDIEEKIGVKKFIKECKSYVNNVSQDWEWYVDHIGRWVDFKKAYRTMDLPYMESVMWVFKQMYNNGLIYKGLRISLFCPHCSTPISNFEVAMDADNYRDIAEPATTYKYQLKDEKDTFILAWSTTPWNKIVTSALAVNPRLVYVKVQQGKEKYILAKKTLKMIKKEPAYKILEEFKGVRLVGKKYIPSYDYYRVSEGKKAFEIIAGDFVTPKEGTGVVTIAPYGEEDLKVMLEKNIHIELHVDDEGIIKKNVPIFGGMDYLKANKAVNGDMENRGLIYKSEDVMHSVAHCWRCGIRLFYAPQNAWYVNVQLLKPKLKKINELVNWFPSHFKYGRFLKSMEAAPDWCISRSRFWGSPVPVWECKCGERFVPGSIKELVQASGKQIADLHKPEIDKITVPCKKCGKPARRVPEVLDSWIEAGSAPYAERHFPFREGLRLSDFFPPDFIVEYTGQIRAWFYVLHVISTAIFNSNAFKNVLVTGVILGTDGRKMSKNYGNYPDPKEMLEKYGGDALRLYLMGSPVMNGEDILIAEEPYRDQVRGMLLILWNVYNFFVSNALADRWNPTGKNAKSDNVLDKWITARLNEAIKMLTSSLNEFDSVNSISCVEKFISDLSLWYVRRSRNRVGITAENIKDKEACYSTLYRVLVTLTKLLAPIVPFISEEIYKNLTAKESVHLETWPIDDKKINESINLQMGLVRKLVEIGHGIRKANNIKVRQPLRKLTYALETKMSKELEDIMLAELNIKKAEYKKGKIQVAIDLKITPELRDEGKAREIIRMIQKERKKLGTRLDEKVNVVLKDWPEKFEDDIKKKAMVDALQKGHKFSVARK